MFHKERSKKICETHVLPNEVYYTTCEFNTSERYQKGQ